MTPVYEIILYNLTLRFWTSTIHFQIFDLFLLPWVIRKGGNKPNGNRGTTWVGDNTKGES